MIKATKKIIIQKKRISKKEKNIDKQCYREKKMQTV